MSIHENTKYQYIRLHDGKEIIAMISEIGDKIEMYLPMSLMCKPSMTGPGVTVHLGPLIPFTNEELVLIDSKDITFRTEITEQFVKLYDESVVTWLDLRDSGRMKIKTQKQEDDNQLDIVKTMIKDMKKREWEEYDNEFEEDLFEIPSKKDIIH